MEKLPQTRFAGYKPNMKVQVELHNPAASDAVQSTIDQLPGSNGTKLVSEDGIWFLEGNKFTAWACERQGYVKAVLWPTLTD